MNRTSTSPESRLAAVPWLLSLLAARHAVDGGVDLGLLAELRDVAEVCDVLDRNRLRPVDVAPPWRVQLRPLTSADLPVVHEAWSAPGPGSLWRSRGTTPGPGEIEELIWAGTDTCLVGEEISTGDPVALLCSYGSNPVAHYTYGALLGLSPHSHQPGRELFLALEAMARFLDHLFDSSPWRKVMFEVPEPNRPLTQGLASSPSDVATFADHAFVAGRWVDVHHVALRRERWAAITEPNRLDPRDLAGWLRAHAAELEAGR